MFVCPLWEKKHYFEFFLFEVNIREGSSDIKPFRIGKPTKLLDFLFPAVPLYFRAL